MKTKSTAQLWAKQTLELRRVAAEIRAEKLAVAKAANAADSDKLDKLADEIATLDARLDPENLDAIQLLAAKREQLARLKIKFAADAQKRLADAADVSSDKRLPTVTVDYSFGQLLDDAESELRADFKKHFRHEAMAERVGNDSDAGCTLRRLQNHASDAERDEIIYAVANGQNPPWKF